MKVKINKKNITRFCAVAVGATIMLSSLSGCGKIEKLENDYTYTHAVVIEEGKTTIIPIRDSFNFKGNQFKIVMKDGNTFTSSILNTKLFDEQAGPLCVEEFAMMISPDDNEIVSFQEKDTSKLLTATEKVLNKINDLF